MRYLKLSDSNFAVLDSSTISIRDAYNSINLTLQDIDLLYHGTYRSFSNISYTTYQGIVLVRDLIEQTEDAYEAMHLELMMQDILSTVFDKLYVSNPTVVQKIDPNRLILLINYLTAKIPIRIFIEPSFLGITVRIEVPKNYIGINCDYLRKELENRLQLPLCPVIIQELHAKTNRLDESSSSPNSPAHLETLE